MFCGRQNVALRFHRDNVTDLLIDPFENHNNFGALLKFRIDAGDTILQEHLAISPKNATYTSSIIQNQLIDIITNQIQRKLLDNVKRENGLQLLQMKLPISPTKTC